ncbi:(3,5-dihydroxyphenyl)acetyl-CoA 1,2-dioxygenase DpgC [Streptomyces sp. NPDC056244]|uniref:(3,5-dihydroxyphenyl)acetyl-CoA 1,2-dioxygenase DpgC n=1 Tax=Streptomyces sp. NPDC056244 TaxID=3345762 RepID=UPI0035E2D1FE
MRATRDGTAASGRGPAGALSLGEAPPLCGALAEDAAALARHTENGERLLERLPAPPDRDAEQRRLAATVFASCRQMREQFMRRHADEVYDVLTEGGVRRYRLSELVFAAATRFPGLVPTRVQVDAEGALIQADKEGREIDQGIFFRGILRSPAAGAHLADTMLLASPRALALIDGFRRDGRVDLGPVLVERRNGAGHLTVRNYHCLNAEDNALVEAMETAVDLVLLDEGVRVGVVRGGVMTHPRYEGRRVFSAGINLSDLRNGRISFVEFLLRRELTYVSKLLRGLLLPPGEATFAASSLHKPWVAAVDSFAIGGGMQLLLVCDRVIAADDAFFSLPAAQEGIVPGAGNLRLGRLTGARLARRIILSGKRIRATDSEADLVCDEVVPGHAMDAAVESAVEELDSPAVSANRAMLALAEESPDQFRTYMAEFAFTQACRLYGEDVISKVDRAWSRSRARERPRA